MRWSKRLRGLLCIGRAGGTVPWKVPSCQEPNYPSERFFCFFPLRGPRAVAIWQRVLTAFHETGTDPTCLHHTRIEALSP
jgi:hypothetical protein